MIYVIKGDPIPLARHRMGAHGAYDIQKKEKLMVGITLASQHDRLPLYEGYLELDITFYLKTSKKKPKTGWHNFKPDLSNLVKFVEDVGSGILYVDDSIISSIIAKKMYDENPRTEFTIRELK